MKLLYKFLFLKLLLRLKHQLFLFLRLGSVALMVLLAHKVRPVPKGLLGRRDRLVTTGRKDQLVQLVQQVARVLQAQRVILGLRDRRGHKELLVRLGHKVRLGLPALRGQLDLQDRRDRRVILARLAPLDPQVRKARRER